MQKCYRWVGGEGVTKSLLTPDLDYQSNPNDAEKIEVTERLESILKKHTTSSKIYSPEKFINYCQSKKQVIPSQLSGFDRHLSQTSEYKNLSYPPT